MIAKLITLICLCAPAVGALVMERPYRLVASGGEIRLRCPYLGRGTPDEVRISLHRGADGADSAQAVCTSTFNHTQSLLQTGGAVQCRGHMGPDGVELTVSGLRGTDTDLYRCMVEVLYPPPYLVSSGKGILFYVPEEPDCPSPAAQAQSNPESSFIILPTAVLACFFILIIVIITVTYKLFRVRSRRREYPGLDPVISKRVDCRFGYENFL
ncbi:T-cell-specific surface glycoprotein CD28-like [Megalops cyprinoides]|uniref:T-cell-specific surface glycoprotein CD28-like n=1 Tax=Megalops cyprinoides TaxID=118141 RepID=UPI0018654770|nr:T-cell-specific surface glycoprotein CD28-like [Megalops cyprinoides]